MNNSINIENYTSIVVDFEIFIKHCLEVRPKLTKSREYINRKTLHEINQKLRTPAQDVNPRNDQQYYLPIHFFYSLALEAELFFIDRSKKNSPYLVAKPEKIKAYQTLSSNSQYLFLLKTYWVHCDWETMVGNDSGRIFVSATDKIIANLVIADLNKIYDRHDEDGQLVQNMNWTIHEHIKYWEFLGWLKAKKITEFGSKSLYCYETVQITELGQAIASILYEKRPLTEWNELYLEHGPNMFDSFSMSLMGLGEEEEENLDMGLPSMPENPTQEQVLQQINLMNQKAKDDLGVDLDLMDFMKQAAQKGKQPSLEDIMNHIVGKMENQLPEEEGEEKESFESAFSTLFPDEDIPPIRVKPEPVFVDGQYVLKVSLLYDEEIWRKVSLNAKHTLLDVHLIIQEAFEFDNDHLYAFYMNPKSRKGINDPRSEEPPFADAYELGNLNLTPSQRFMYLFDFGDSWEFTIDVVEIKERTKKLNAPKIIEKKGKAPEQYEFYDEEDEFDEWF